MTDQTPVSAQDNIPAEKDILPDLDIESLQNIDFTSLSSVEEAVVQIGVVFGSRLIAASLILIVGWSLGSLINRKINSFSRVDPMVKGFLGRFFKYTIFIVAIVTVIGLFGIPMTSLLAVLGAAGLAIGLALQGTLSNVAAGVMLLILRPFNVGDYITFGGEGGTVRTLGLFGTELAMPDNVYIFAPNSRIWGNEIRNFSRNPVRRQDLKVGISYNDDINKAFATIYRVLGNDDRIMHNDPAREPVVLVDNMADFSIDLIVRFWSDKGDVGALRSDVLKAIKEAFDKEGITIPFPTRTVEMVGGENLSPDEQRDIAAAAG